MTSGNSLFQLIILGHTGINEVGLILHIVMVVWQIPTKHIIQTRTFANHFTITFSHYKIHSCTIFENRTTLLTESCQNSFCS